MLKYFFKRDLLKQCYSKEEIEEKVVLTYPAFKIRFFFSFFLYWFSVFPPSIMLGLIIVGVLYSDLFMVIEYLVFFILTLIPSIFLRIYHDDLTRLLTKLEYFRKYSIGPAISEKDFKIIRGKDEDLYEAMRNMRCSGYCYLVCLRFLKCLGKGKVILVATPASGEAREESPDILYEAHMLYENHRWVYDTYTHRQWRKKDYFKFFEVPWEYRSFDSFDLEEVGGDLTKFAEKYGPEFKDFCERNHCYERFSEI